MWRQCGAITCFSQKTTQYWDKGGVEVVFGLSLCRVVSAMREKSQNLCIALLWHFSRDSLQMNSHVYFHSLLRKGVILHSKVQHCGNISIKFGGTKGAKFPPHHAATEHSKNTRLWQYYPNMPPRWVLWNKLLWLTMNLLSQWTSGRRCCQNWSFRHSLESTMCGERPTLNMAFNPVSPLWKIMVETYCCGNAFLQQGWEDWS